MSSSNRSSKHDRNREKIIQDRLQLLLTKMLQDEDNKYCVDCDSKGPRWASWNLGIFMCIRCAGIHRNLGVHISRVKSVNLDSWTPVQVSSMQIMGNSRGRAVYEARVPEDFRRPQSDQQMETFIRNKYEKKKYVALEWKPTQPPDLPQGWAEIIEAEKQKKDIRTIVLPSRVNSSHNPSSLSKNPSSKSVPEKAKSANDNSMSTNGATTKEQTSVTNSSAAFDLLCLNSATTSPPANSNPVSTKDSLQSIAQIQPPDASANGASNKIHSQLDLLCIGEGDTANDNDFDDFIGAPSINKAIGNNNGPQIIQKSSNSADLEQLTSSGFSSNGQSNGEKEKPGAMSKDSIMALFNNPQTSTPSVTQSAIGVQAGFGGSYSSGLQGINTGNNTSFNFNMTGGINTSGGIPNNGVTVGGGLAFQQQPPMMNHFGMQQPAGAMSTMNNPFLTNVGTTANNTATSNSSNQGWGFLN